MPRPSTVEDDDRELVVHAEVIDVGSITRRPAVEHVHVRDLVELGGGGVELRVGGVDAVDARVGALQHRLGRELGGAQRGGVSVVKNGSPVPPAKITTRPFSRWRIARRRM